ncbi:hypothetical protein GCM10027072_73470 [Streptomyces bullii]
MPAARDRAAAKTGGAPKSEDRRRTEEKDRHVRAEGDFSLVDRRENDDAVRTLLKRRLHDAGDTAPVAFHGADDPQRVTRVPDSSPNGHQQRGDAVPGGPEGRHMDGTRTTGCRRPGCFVQPVAKRFGSVENVAAPLGGHVRLAVEDPGHGLPPDAGQTSHIGTERHGEAAARSLQSRHGVSRCPLANMAPG